MAGEGLLRAVAVAAAACGTVAVVSGNGAMAAGAGVGAIATAVLAVRQRGWRTDEMPPIEHPLTDAIDLRLPVPQSSAPAWAPESSSPTLSTSPQLLDGDYLEAALRGRVAVARRALRPLSVVHIMIERGDVGGSVPASLVAAAAEATLRESDIVGRTQDGVYVVILEDTGEDGAVWTTERLRRHVAGTIEPRRFQAGVASYPSHGLDAVSVDASAARALVAARDWDRDRIEVAVH